MRCSKPLLRIEDLSKWETAADGHLYHPARVDSTDRLEYYTGVKAGQKIHKTIYGSHKYEIIPCGHCIECRIEKSRGWANRGYLESTLWKQNWFVTLTYEESSLYIPDMIEIDKDDQEWIFEEPDSLEWKGCLIPTDLRQFMVNLRQIMQREFNHTGVRMMACGEYGSKYRRPHYHLILFNCPLPIESFYDPKVRWEKYTYYKNDIIERAWGRDDTKSKEEKGICEITEATWDTIAYTARYITKKMTGEENWDYYAKQGEIPEFFRASNRPGIGKGYYDLHKDEIYKYDKILIKNGKGSKWVSPPKYFDDWLKKDDPKLYEEIKRKRQIKMFNSLLLQKQQTSLSQYEQLQVEHETAVSKLKMLKRPEF